ncbi:CDP-glycerol glycerophosphotransferase family protein [Neobacillus sp. NPDC093127]|uniref:CDP-glycerol glycerophosphotransferase family protein n=1 Tax=Neobacillus sp. NPDC093127 TaxID=3364296 RepID=UPI00382C9DDD
MKRLKLIPTILTKALVSIVYQFYCLIFPVNQQKVTFASYRSDDIQGNLLYLQKEVNQQYPEFLVVDLFKKFDSSRSGKCSYILHMLISTYHLATSRYFFIDDYYFPVYFIKPRKRTSIIQVWHAAGAFKKFGYSTVGKSFGPSSHYLKHVKVHSNYSNVIVSAAEVIPFYAEAFHMPAAQILPLGLPRSDYFFQREEHIAVRKRLLQLYPELNGKKLILYAPTFRGKSHQQSVSQSYLDFAVLKTVLGNGYALVVKLHPYIKSELNIDKGLTDFVYQIDDEFNTEEILTLADVLITDYSAIIFDYCLLGRPIAFYANDLEAYVSERDFYYPYESFVPGPIFTKPKDLAFWIKEEEFNLPQVHAFRKRFFDVYDGQVSRKIIETIISTKV